MDQKTGITLQNRSVQISLLGTLVVLLAFACTWLVFNGSPLVAKHAINGHSGGQTENRTTEPQDNHEHRQILAIASALGLAADTADLSTAVKGVVDERQELRGKYGDLLTKHTTLTTQHATLNREHGDLRKAKADYEVRVRNAAQKASANLSQRLAKTSARQVATTPGKAIPFVGIGFVAAFTALDVYEACEMVKALNEMNIELSNQTDLATRDKVCGLTVPTQTEISAQLRNNWQAAYSSAANAANQAGKSFSVTPPTIDASQMTKQACSIFAGRWFCS